MNKTIVVVVALSAPVILSASFYLFFYQTDSSSNEFQTIQAKMYTEAARLEAEFAVCFENLQPADLENLSDSEIQLFVENLMPKPSQELLEENILVAVMNSVSIRALENENVRVVQAEM